MLYPLRGYRRLVRFDASSQVYDKAHAEVVALMKEMSEAQHKQSDVRNNLIRLARDMKRAGASPAIVGKVESLAKEIEKHMSNSMGWAAAFYGAETAIGSYCTRRRTEEKWVSHNDLPGGGTPGRSPYNNGRLG